MKFQFFKAESLYRYDDERYKITKKFETPREWLPELIEEAIKAIKTIKGVKEIVNYVTIKE